MHQDILTDRLFAAKFLQTVGMQELFVTRKTFMRPTMILLKLV